MEKENNVVFLILSTLPLHFLWNRLSSQQHRLSSTTSTWVTPSFLNQSIVDCSQNTSMYYGALTPQSFDYYATKYLKNPLRWEAGSLGYNSNSSDDDFSQADVCNIQSALGKLNIRNSFLSKPRSLHARLWLGIW